ncbi:MAG: hypothetical protein ABI665_03865 [Vicinamibacterales bacterium]
MRLIVYTAAIGGETDTVQAPDVIDPTVRYLCFSDRPCVAPYEWLEVPTPADGSLPSRRVKVLADHPALQDADATLWHDASYRLTGSLQWAIEGFERADIVAMRHPKRTRIEEEAVAIARWGYVTVAEALRVVREYRLAGFVSDALTSAGLLGRRCSAAMTRLNATWWQEVQRWRGRDQASFDYAAWVAGVTVGYVPGTVRQNPYAAWRTAVPA